MFVVFCLSFEAAASFQLEPVGAAASGWGALQVRVVHVESMALVSFGEGWMANHPRPCAAGGDHAGAFGPFGDVGPAGSSRNFGPMAVASRTQGTAIWLLHCSKNGKFRW